MLDIEQIIIYLLVLKFVKAFNIEKKQVCFVCLPTLSYSFGIFLSNCCIRDLPIYRGPNFIYSLAYLSPWL